MYHLDLLRLDLVARRHFSATLRPEFVSTVLLGGQVSRCEFADLRRWWREIERERERDGGREREREREREMEGEREREREREREKEERVMRVLAQAIPSRMKTPSMLLLVPATHSNILSLTVNIQKKYEKVVEMR